jgi:pSer/pThr/pTyr-binding forkhead associated (FHA) protein
MLSRDMPRYDRRRMARATLTVAGGPGSGRSFDVTGAIEIGRGLTGSPDLADPTISRRHARLAFDAAGQLTIEDLGSHNGTRVNGRITTDAEPLAVGAVIDLGDTTVVVVAIEAAEVAKADQQTKLKATPEHDEDKKRAATRSRSIAAGLPVLSVRSLVSVVRLRVAVATVAVVVLLWLVLFLQERSGNDPGLKKTTAQVAPATSTPSTGSSTTSTPSTGSSTTSSQSTSPTTSQTTTKSS